MFWNEFFTPFNWILYLLICFPLAILAGWLLPYRYKFPPVLVIGFFYLLCAGLFIGGLFISLIILFLIHSLRRKTHNHPYSLTYYPDYQKAPVSTHPSYGEGSAYQLITSHRFAKELRQKMVATLNQYKDKVSQVNRINQLALQDETEEVRLYAQIYIEQQEREITFLVKRLSKKIEETKNETRRAHYQKMMAVTLWEQIYKNLFLPENLLPILAKIQEYAGSAFKMLPKDIELPLLLAKIELRKDHLKEAQTWLEIAQQKGAPDYKVLAYLAEIAYQEKKWEEVPRLLNKIQSQGILGLEPLLSFWVKHDRNTF